MRHLMKTSALLLLAGTAAAQTPAPTPSVAAAIAGTWEGSFPHEGSVWYLSVVLEQQDSVITGVLYKDGEEMGPVAGTIHTDRFAFAWDKIPFEGSVAGDRLRVTLTVYNGTKYHFVMQRRNPGPQ
jgi:hypothetical protein